MAPRLSAPPRTPPSRSGPAGGPSPIDWRAGLAGPQRFARRLAPRSARRQESAAVSVLPIRLFGDPVLRMKAQPVTDFDKELRTLVKDLADTMTAAPGAGLAAPQLGVSLRVFVYHVDGELG